MKFLIFVCIFVVFAHHEIYGLSRHYPALLEGNCKPYEVPARIIDSCNKVQCTKQPNGALAWSAVGCSYTYCANGKEIGTGPHDLSQKYPNCCYPRSCD